MCSRQSSVYKKGNGVFLPETGLLNSIHYFSNSPWIKELYLFNIYNRKCSIYNVAIEFSIYNFDTRLGYILFIFPHWFGSSIFPEFSLWSMYCTVLYCTVLYCTVLTVLYCTDQLRKSNKKLHYKIIIFLLMPLSVLQFPMLTNMIRLAGF